MIEFYTAVRLSRVLNGTLPFYTHFCYSYTDFDWKCAFFNHPIHYHSNPNPGGGGVFTLSSRPPLHTDKTPRAETYIIR